MKIVIYVLIAAAGLSITACTDSTQSKKEPEMEKHDSTHKEKKEADTLGMKMGGNELDSKKK